MPFTEDALVDRVRRVCDRAGYAEATGFDFSKVPSQAFERQPWFTVGYVGETPTGGLGLTEEARGVLTVSVARLTGSDHQATRRTLFEDGRTLLSAIVRDGAITSGEYAVEDAGRSTEIDAPAGASYLVGRFRVPVNFEATL